MKYIKPFNQFNTARTQPNPNPTNIYNTNIKYIYELLLCHPACATRPSVLQPRATFYSLREPCILPQLPTPFTSYFPMGLLSFRFAQSTTQIHPKDTSY